jgi:hypothetical protein
MNSTTNALLALLISAGAAIAAPITYQGTLEENGEPANGLYDMRFSLADSEVFGFLLQFIDVNNVEVVDGLFEVEADFNDSWFDGSDRWLAVRVESTTLSPRTKINYAPYAIRATSAQQANLALDLQVPWVSSNSGNIINATSTGGNAIFGRSNSTAGFAFAIHGEISSTSPGSFASAVRGENQGTGSAGIGVYGSQNGSGFGVYGTTPSGIGVIGFSGSGLGLSGSSVSDVGVEGRTSSGPHAGEFLHTGEDTFAYLATENYGVQGVNDETNGEGTGVYGSGGYRGVYGISDNTGFGPSLTRIGVEGFAGAFTTGADTFYGVRGFGQNPIEGGSRTSYGVYGGAQVGNSSNTAYGVYGETFGPGGTKYAGYFRGNVHVLGTLSKSSGSFKIDHPLDPENKYLSHSFVESPDMMNIYNGVITLDANGTAVVELPDYFEALNRNFRYQLTAIGAPMPNLYIASEISANQFVISGGVSNARVSWEVTGVRQDPSALAHPIVVEEDKPEQHQGKYLDPEAFGFGAEHSIHPRPEQPKN